MDFCVIQNFEWEKRGVSGRFNSIQRGKGDWQKKQVFYTGAYVRNEANRFFQFFVFIFIVFLFRCFFKIFKKIFK